MAAEGPRTHLEEPKIWQVKEEVPFKELGEVAAKSRNLTLRDSGVPSWVNDTHTGSLSLSHAYPEIQGVTSHLAATFQGPSVRKNWGSQ